MNEKEVLSVGGSVEYPQLRFLKDGTHEIWLDEKNKIDKKSPLSGLVLQGLFIKDFVNRHFL